jgi:hypothetical protein
MGYTHYFRHGETTEDKWAAIVEDCKTLHDNLPGDIWIAGWDGTGKPVFDKDKIRFNGAKPAAYETFQISRKPERNGWEDERRMPFKFCKTARQPYDLFVCACLLVYKRHSPDTMELGSDGDAVDWVDAERFVHAVLGYNASFELFVDR